MATKLNIYNNVLSKMGQRRLTALNEDNENRRKIDNVYDRILEELIVAGPEKGWKFAKRRNIAVDRDYSDIVSFSDYSSIVSGEILVKTRLAHNLLTGNDIEIDSTTNYDGYHEDITFISANQFTITADYVADDATGYVYWDSDEYAYRFKTPSECKRITSVKVGGMEITDWTEEDGYLLTNMENVTIYVDYVRLVDKPILFPPMFTKVFYLSIVAELNDSIAKSTAKTEKVLRELEVATDKAIAIDEQRKYVEEVSTEWIDAGR